MHAEHAALWDRLRAFDLDDPAPLLTFHNRLARENRWDADYARRVIEEYKRFALLAVVAGHPVTPSDAVDQAWHLHLVYTRSYWDEFCGRVLGRPLHHGPTRGGAAESAKHQDWYAKTLDAYGRVFGEEPPSDIWPPVTVRFGRDLHFARVNTRTHWVIPRPGWIARRAVDRLASVSRRVFRRKPILLRVAAATAVLIAAALTMGGCVAPGAGGLWGIKADLAGMSGPDFLRFYVPLAMIGLVAASWLRRRFWWNTEESALLDDGPPTDAGKLNPYEAALLVHGPTRDVLARVALVRLVGCGTVEVVGSTPPRVAIGPGFAPGRLDSFEEVVLEEVRRGPKSLRQVARAVGASPASSEIEARLLKWGALVGPEAARTVRLIPALLLVFVLALGLWRLNLGLSRGRPVGFLVITCIVLGGAAAIHLLVRPWRTPRGNAMAASLRQHAAPAGASADPSTAALSFAVLGASALPVSAAYEAIRIALARPEGTGGGCGGGGGGCGGGGGGGGCGGGCGG